MAVFSKFPQILGIVFESVKGKKLEFGIICLTKGTLFIQVFYLLQ